MAVKVSRVSLDLNMLVLNLYMFLLKKEKYNSIIEQGWAKKGEGNWEAMLEKALEAKGLFGGEVLGHQQHGEALVMLGQAEENAEEAIKKVEEGMEYLRKGLGLCKID